MPFVPSSTFHLTTPRLYISHFHAPQHNQFLVDLYNSELYTKHNKTNIDTPAKAQAQIENWMPGWHERNGYGPYVVSLRFAQDIVGESNTTTTAADDYEKANLLKLGQVPIGILTLMRGSHYTVPDCGFALLPTYAGKGYATEAGRRLVQYATDPKKPTTTTSTTSEAAAASAEYDEDDDDVPREGQGLGLEGVFGFTSSNNADSRKVCERLGLEFRGVYPLEAFGGAPSAVFALPGMEADLSVYGIKASRTDTVE
ncbi:Acyl-CoA N-acyltransferase [Apiospora phragmitis]|uniref:Acyl-CoA N-acyltransferase n=1 Tax=Apiospora phragmitis TaxID=2905665 RepID=A0ABR1X619_9PEZI